MPLQYVSVAGNNHFFPGQRFRLLQVQSVSFQMQGGVDGSDAVVPTHPWIQRRGFQRLNRPNLFVQPKQKVQRFGREAVGRTGMHSIV